MPETTEDTLIRVFRRYFCDHERVLAQRHNVVVNHEKKERNARQWFYSLSKPIFNKEWKEEETERMKEYTGDHWQHFFDTITGTRQETDQSRQTNTASNMHSTYAETALNVSGQENDAAILYEAVSGATLAPFVSPDVVRRQHCPRLIHFSRKIRMTGCIDNVENHGGTIQGLVGNFCDFGCDGNSSLLFQIARIHETRQGFGGRWVITLFGCHQQLVNHGCLAMIDVGNNGHIANHLTSKGFEIRVHWS